MSHIPDYIFSEVDKEMVKLFEEYRGKPILDSDFFRIYMAAAYKFYRRGVGDAKRTAYEEAYGVSFTHNYLPDGECGACLICGLVEGEHKC